MELERKVQSLQTEATTLSAQLTLYQVLIFTYLIFCSYNDQGHITYLESESRHNIGEAIFLPLFASYTSVETLEFPCYEIS